MSIHADCIGPTGNAAVDSRRRGSLPTATPPPNPNSLRPEDKDSPEYKKKAAMAAGPVLNVENTNSESYNMDESLFSALKDLFESMVSYEARTGVVSPQRFIDTLKLKNELFRGQMHQDAHEFLNYLLNEVVENVEEHSKVMTNTSLNSSLLPNVTSPKISNSPTLSSTGWVHDLFEGALTSETKCLTCENVSRRDEPFLDLSIDLEKHSSVTSCLRNFSASEMLCERNKFHCDGCGGLQEAEKRMKIRRLPRILALHLKRFKYTEDLQRHQKLFHRVVYPYHLRLFNTTDDAEDPDRLYELYAIVVHIGGGPYHGHYVSIVKTEDKGWLLYDDEMVEPVDKSYVRNFFGDKPGLACAYVLFYQETTLEAVQKEEKADREAAAAAAAATVDAEQLKAATVHGMNGSANGYPNAQKTYDDEEAIETRNSTPESPKTPLVSPNNIHPIDTSGLPKTPNVPTSPGPNNFIQRFPTSDVTGAVPSSPLKSKKEREREKKEEKEREKAAKKDEKEHNSNRDSTGHGLSRFRPGSMSMSGKKAFSWTVGKDKEKEKEKIPPTPPINMTFDNDTQSQRSATAPLLPNNNVNGSVSNISNNGNINSSYVSTSNGSALLGKLGKDKKKDKSKDEDEKNGDHKHHHRLTLKKKLSILSSS